MNSPSNSPPGNQLINSAARDSVNRNSEANITETKSDTVDLFADPDSGNAQTNNVINISNSNEVVIGPMMQYQGSVTIYQYMNTGVASGVEGGLVQGISNIFFDFVIN